MTIVVHYRVPAALILGFARLPSVLANPMGLDLSQRAPDCRHQPSRPSKYTSGIGMCKQNGPGIAVPRPFLRWMAAEGANSYGLRRKQEGCHR